MTKQMFSISVFINSNLKAIIEYIEVEPERGEMMSGVYYLIAFDSINYANYLESELKKYGHRVLMVETPEFLTKDYYVSLKIYEEALAIVQEIISDTKLKRYKIYKQYSTHEKKAYKEVKPYNNEYDRDLSEMLFNQSDETKDENNISDTGVVEIEMNGIKETSEAEKEKKNEVDYEVIESKDDIQGFNEEEKESKPDYCIPETKKRVKSEPIELIEKLVQIKKQVNSTIKD